MKKFLRAAIALIVFPWVGAVPIAAELKSASVILNEIQAAIVDKQEEVEDPAARWVSQFENYKREQPKLSPQQAAQKWLELFEARLELPVESRFGGREDETAAQKLIEALPGPDSWEELEQLIAGRADGGGEASFHDLILQLIAATLKGDNAAQGEILEKVKTYLDKHPKSSSMGTYYLKFLNEAIVQSSAEPDQIYKSLLRMLEESEGERRFSPEVRLPNLLAVLDRSKAEEIIRKALLLPNTRFHIRGRETGVLARKLAIEMVNELKAPPWQLAQSTEAVELYEALVKRFSESEKKKKDPFDDIPHRVMGDHERKSAKTFYALGLLKAGRLDDAKTLLVNLSEDEGFSISFLYLERHANRTEIKALAQIFQELLKKKPDLQIWDAYVRLAVQSGEVAEAIQVIEETLASGKISAKTRSVLSLQRFRALLAADKVDAALEHLRNSASDPGKFGTNFDGGVEEIVQAYAKLGRALEKPDLVLEGAKILDSNLSKLSADNFYRTSIAFSVLAASLIEMGELAKAQDFLVRGLKWIQESGEYGIKEQSQQLLHFLAYLYSRNGQHQEVLVLLEKAPWWGVKDLAQLRDDFSDSKEIPNIRLIAAKALAASGKEVAGAEIVRNLLLEEGGNDPAYELLIEIEKEKSIPFLDKLQAIDRFEERPLIWKAQLLFDLKKLAEAEKIIRQAIAIDPSDGEQGPGSRMRAYVVLGRIRSSLGDQKEAEFLKNVEKSIRLSEAADKVNEAGLASRALKMYEQALTFFADAYCVQSRLALRMSELGLYEQAEKHYLKAYELMPDSFGRVESHCFGCENIFGSPQAQSIAEKVFERLAKASPEKPQLHYLLGYLRKEQGKSTEAKDHFMDAVRLDPDYLNAWKELAVLSDELFMSAEEREKIALNLVRLDPLARHTSPNLSQIRDLAQFWRLVETAAKLLPDKKAELFPLTASRQKIEDLQKAAREAGEAHMMDREFNWDPEVPVFPGERLASHPILQAAINLIDIKLEAEE